jgi:3-oxoacyl-[acyl-carrier-protein] synthase II
MFPLDSMDMPSNSSVNFVSVFFGFLDFARTISAGFTSSHDALGNALQLIRRGRAKRVIVAGMEQLSPELFTLFYKRGLLAHGNDEFTEACRAFDQQRNGLVLSEGGYALVIEEDQLAASRDASPLAEITGFANGFIKTDGLNDNSRLERMCRIMRAAITNASIVSEELDLIYTAANGTEETDLLEARTLNNVFWNGNPPICAIKPQMGEGFGASGVMQISIAALALANNINPPLNQPKHLDPLCKTRPRTKNPLVERLQKVIINGLDLAGNYSCLILEKYNRDE